MKQTIIDNLRAALAAINKREGQWVHDDCSRYVLLTVAEMEYLLKILQEKSDAA